MVASRYSRVTFCIDRLKTVATIRDDCPLFLCIGLLWPNHFLVHRIITYDMATNL